MAAPNEAAISEARGRTRQNKEVPFLINIEDFRLVPNVKLIAQNPKYRPYHGDVNATLEQRRAYVTKLGRQVRVINTSEDDDTVDIGKMNADQLLAFAADEFGAALNPAHSEAKLRQEVARLAGLDVKTPTITNTGGRGGRAKASAEDFQIPTAASGLGAALGQE
jgi:hypothetical protein